MFNFQKVEINGVFVYLASYSDFKIDEKLNFLHPTEKVKFNQFRSEKRQREFLATRILKEHLFPERLINYTKEGAPYIENGPNISISHANNHTAIAICENYKVGLDIEPFGDKAHRLQSKFLNAHEIQLLETASTIEMTRAWSCKEALYKLWEKKKLFLSVIY